MSDPDTQYDMTAVDLSNCDREPIHILGHTQSFGCLLAMSSDWLIAHASVNCHDLLGLAADDLIGQPFLDYFSQEFTHLLRTQVQSLANLKGAARMFRIDVFGDGRLFDISVHRADRTFVCEFEPRETAVPNRDDTALVQALIARVQRHNDLEQATQEAARGLQVLLGMDRVMVYRFEEDGTGTVIAESLRGAGDSYLGLRYPASDIPKQARALYKRSLLRIIPDVEAPTHPIIPAQSPTGQPLDLSLAITRAVSPIHLEYLRNMGVGASMSVSILRRGELWGLFACHHNSAYHVDYERRSAIELFVQMFNYELAHLETARELEDLDRARDLHDTLMTQVSGSDTLMDVFQSLANEIAAVIPHDGLVVYVDGMFRAIGATPTEDEFLGLARFLNTTRTSEIYASHQIGARYDRADQFADRAAGVLALPISRKPRDYLVLFRRELVHSVRWAGNPDKPVIAGPNGPRLTPRKSFEAWQDVVRGQCAPWRSGEQRAAEALRITLLEVVLKLSDEANASRKRAEEQQELLIAELNHRVRNILNLIRGLISQGRGDAVTIEEYSDVLDKRIHSLARAHDQLTEENWGWISLRALIGTEVDAFLSDDRERVAISGDDIALSPTAFTSMALVMHELVTNSVKYGALSDTGGRVTLDVTLNADGTASLDWTEQGGPVVQPPTRKGFGTTIIERSVPFELKGSAELRFRPSGIEAAFVLPTLHVRKMTRAIAQAAQDAADVAEAARVATTDITLSGEALVVEDNMIIAMDAADMLTELGAEQVHTAGDVATALGLLDGRQISFALLDVNLGAEVSLKVAEACAALNIPAILATGYGGEGDAVSDYPQKVVLRKPYTFEHVQKGLSDLFAGL
ncbi:MAG: two-component system sensor histidine kinase/response regulator [Alphaproteobacteria bacterium MedPE-SWcel]|nr:MAG: two-component system sensor histidine kinase/response regulator [Alphaproteobacteria bacterium MedPE-SWcel]